MITLSEKQGAWVACQLALAHLLTGDDRFQDAGYTGTFPARVCAETAAKPGDIGASDGRDRPNYGTRPSGAHAAVFATMKRNFEQAWPIHLERLQEQQGQRATQ